MKKKSALNQNSSPLIPFELELSLVAKIYKKTSLLLEPITGDKYEDKIIFLTVYLQRQINQARLHAITSIGPSWISRNINKDIISIQKGTNNEAIYQIQEEILTSEGFQRIQQVLEPLQKLITHSLDEKEDIDSIKKFIDSMEGNLESPSPDKVSSLYKIINDYKMKLHQKLQDHEIERKKWHEFLITERDLEPLLLESDEEKWGSRNAWQEIVKNCLQKAQNLIITGPMGIGKSILCQQIIQSFLDTPAYDNIIPIFIPLNEIEADRDIYRILAEAIEKIINPKHNPVKDQAHIQIQTEIIQTIQNYVTLKGSSNPLFHFLVFFDGYDELHDDAFKKHLESYLHQKTLQSPYLSLIITGRPWSLMEFKEPRLWSEEKVCVYRLADLSKEQVRSFLSLNGISEQNLITHFDILQQFYADLYPIPLYLYILARKSIPELQTPLTVYDILGEVDKSAMYWFLAKHIPELEEKHLLLARTNPNQFYEICETHHKSVEFVNGKKTSTYPFLSAIDEIYKFMLDLSEQIIVPLLNHNRDLEKDPLPSSLIIKPPESPLLQDLINSGNYWLTISYNHKKRPPQLVLHLSPEKMKEYSITTFLMDRVFNLEEKRNLQTRYIIAILGNTKITRGLLDHLLPTIRAAIIRHRDIKLKLQTELESLSIFITDLLKMEGTTIPWEEWFCNQIQLKNIETYQKQCVFLNLSHHKLTTLPESIGNLTKLETLWIHHNVLTSLPESLGNLTSLKELWLQSNNLTSLPKSIGNLTKLETLWINHNVLTSLPEIITKMTWLRVLNLSGNGMNSLPKGIGNLTALQYLYLSSNELKYLPDSLFNLKSLIRLDLRDNKLLSLPEINTKMTWLRVLNLSGNGMNSLPGSIGNLTSLQYLDLFNNKLKYLPDSIGKLKSLKRLELPYNSLSYLPDSIGNLSALQKLFLHDNKLERLPESIGNLTKLETLWIKKNALSSLPESLGNLTSLKELWLQSNNLTSLPDSIGNLKSLKVLRLQSNNLTSLPESLGNLSALQKLFLHDNKLERLPRSIGNLTSLQYLDLFNNKLKYLPEGIGNLTALQYLSLYKNQLTSLPDSIGNLKSLNELDLGGNSLSSLPDSIGNLSALQILYLHDNKLERLPASTENALKKLKQQGCLIY